MTRFRVLSCLSLMIHLKVCSIRNMVSIYHLLQCSIPFHNLNSLLPWRNHIFLSSSFFISAAICSLPSFPILFLVPSFHPSYRNEPCVRSCDYCQHGRQSVLILLILHVHLPKICLILICKAVALLATSWWLTTVDSCSSIWEHL